MDSRNPLRSILNCKGWYPKSNNYLPVHKYDPHLYQFVNPPSAFTKFLPILRDTRIANLRQMSFRNLSFKSTTRYIQSALTLQSFSRLPCLPIGFQNFTVMLFSPPLLRTNRVSLLGVLVFGVGDESVSLVHDLTEVILAACLLHIHLLPICNNDYTRPIINSLILISSTYLLTFSSMNVSGTTYVLSWIFGQSLCHTYQDQILFPPSSILSSY